jgi:hypothetical protein
LLDALQGSEGTEATEETGFASTTSDITIPAGSQGGLMVVTLGFQGTGGSGEIRYTYEWQGP